MTAVLRVLLGHNSQMFKVSQPSWDFVLSNGATVYYEPCEEVYVYLGKLLLEGYLIKSKPITEVCKIPVEDSLMLFTQQEPVLTILSDCRIVTLNRTK